jgi:hypothetical protein
MSNPNIVNVTDIKGKTAVANVTTLPSILVNNDAGSNKVFKINSLIISNVDGQFSGSIDVDLYRQGSPYFIVKTVTIPNDASLDVLNKSIYLEEGDSLRTTASSNLLLQAVCSYEEIS